MIRTLEFRRQLIWDSRAEGYWNAIEDLEYEHDPRYAAAIRFLKSKASRR